MATLRSLQIILGAKTTAFDRKIHKSAMRIRKFAGGVGRVTKRLMQFGAIAAGVVAAGLTVMVKRAFTTIDALAKMSDRLGIATEDLSRLAHAAEIMGVDQAGLNKSLEMFVRRMGEARQGIGEARDALIRLGLNVDELVKHSPAEAMALISDRMRHLKTDADKAATAYQLFGRQGTKLLNLLNLSAAEFRALTAEADKLGLTFSRIDAAKVEAANDAITRMKALLRGVAQTMAIQIAPLIDSMATGLVEWASSGEGAAAKVVRAMASIVEAAGGVVGAVDQVRISLAGFAMPGSGTKETLETYLFKGGAVGLAAKSIAAGTKPEDSDAAIILSMQIDVLKGKAKERQAIFEGIVADMRTQADALAAAPGGKGIAIAELGGTQGLLGMFASVGDTIHKQMVGPLGLAVGKFGELQKAGEALRGNVASFAVGLRQAVETPVETLQRNLKDLRAALHLHEITQEQYRRGVKMFREQAIARAAMPAAADPGQFRVLSRGVSAEGLTVGADQRVQHKQLTELEKIEEKMSELVTNSRSGGMPT